MQKAGGCPIGEPSACVLSAGNHSERRALTGSHLEALLAGIRPPRMVSSVASAISTSAACSGRAAVTEALVALGEKPFRVGECVEGSGKVVYSDER